MVSIDELIESNRGIRLDIGCGPNKQANFIGLDVQPLPGVDVVWDINRHPWPLPDECAILAMCSHLIEHIPTIVIDGGITRFPFLEFMDEVWRIMKVKGEFMIAVPHGNSQGFQQDPTHVHAINETMWYYFDPDPEHNNAGGQFYGFYQPKPWKVKYLAYDPTANIEVILVKRNMFIAANGEVRYE